MYAILRDIDQNPGLSVRNNACAGEEGKDEGIRGAVLKGIEKRLLATIAAADKFKSLTKGVNSHATATFSSAGWQGKAPTVGPGSAPSGSVKNRANFFQEKIDNQGAGEKLNAEVVRVRQWLFRQGATLTPEGKIIWPVSERVVSYDHGLEKQGLTQLTMRDGGFYGADGSPFDTTRMVTVFSGTGFGIYVMSVQGNLHSTSHAAGFRHHSSLLGGAPVAGAGELQVRNGKLMLLSNKSGHYTPDVFNLLKTLAVIAAAGIPLNFRIRHHTAHAQTDYNSVDEFMIANMFDDASYLPTIQAADLDASSSLYVLYGSASAGPVYGNVVYR